MALYVRYTPQVLSGGGGSSGGVTSLNTEIGALTLVSGDSSVVITEPTSTSIDLSVPAGAGLTLTAFGSTPNPNGLTLTAGVLNMEPADATHPGGLSTTTQTIAGAKTFTGDISAANLTGQNSGDSNVVFRPGGIQGGVVYNNWVDLYAAIVTLDVAAVDVCFDDSIASCEIPAGSYDLINVTFQAPTGRSSLTKIDVTLLDGCTFVNFPAVANLIRMISASTTPVFTVPSSPSTYLIRLQLTGTLESISGAPLITVPGGVTLLLSLLSNSEINGVSGFPLIELQSNANLTVGLGVDADFSKDTVSGDASTSILVVVGSPSGTYNSSQAGFTGSFFVQYNPTIENIKVGTGLGDMPYASSAQNGLILSANNSTTKMFLTSTGTGIGGNAPVWATISASDLPAVTSTAVTNVSNNASYFLTMISASTTGSYAMDVAAGVSFNPSTSKLSTTSLNLSSLTASFAVVTDASKNLASLGYSISSTASNLLERDSNANAFANNFVDGFVNITSAGGTYTMTAASPKVTRIANTGGTQLILLPDATTLQVGTEYTFYVLNTDTTTNLVTVQASTGAAVTTLGGRGRYTFLNTTNTGSGVWSSSDVIRSVPSGGTGQTSQSSHSVLIGAGIAAFSSVGPDTSTVKVLTAAGSSADPTFQFVSASSFDTKTANTILAGPTTGAAATPTFRALVAADMPSINIRYYNSSTTISGSLATVVWTTKDYENGSSGAMVNGVYTVPTTGKYLVNCRMAIAATIILNNNADLQVQKNGSVISEDEEFAGGAIANFGVGVSDIINCTAGDTLRVQVSTNGSSPSIQSSNFRNYISIALVGV